VRSWPHATLVLALAALLSCSGSGSSPTSTVPPTLESQTFALTVVARAASEAPEDYDIEPGKLIAGAQVHATNRAAPDAPAEIGTTDDAGRVVLMVRSGSYNVTVKRDTHDPYCFWYAGEETEVTDGPVTVSVDDLWVLCE
jgi:hypothetical protein